MVAATEAAATEATAPEATKEEELVVTAAEMDGRIRPPRIIADEAFLLERQPRNVSEMLRFLPGVSVKTNSRGETIARVRGSEERQTQLFLDGAPLAVPWDGRIDIGALPAGLISEVEVAKGAVPIEYGTNAVAGAIDLRTVGRKTDGIQAMAQLGSGGFGTASVVGSVRTGAVNVLVAASGLTRDFEPVANPDALPFSQAPNGRRTNTDLESHSLFGALGYAGSAVEMRASLLRFSTSRGIAPESDRDPALAPPRYWRYPDTDLTQFTLSAAIDLDNQTTLRAVGWRQLFSQSIDAYSDATYSSLRSRQRDQDDTLGSRLTLSRSLAGVTMRLTGNAQTSQHTQVDTNLRTGVASPRLVYRQNLFTLGAEVDVPIGPASATFGVAHDRATTPRTGDKPPQPNMDAVAFSFALQGEVAENTTLTLSGGRRTRFPSARELFGEALGRFLINPDLRPETAWLADIELAWRSPSATLTLNPFYARGEDTLGQRVVQTGGTSLRQRYNMAGTRTYGIDGQLRFTFAPSLVPGLDAEVFGTALSALADPGDAPFRTLLQRPAYEVGGALQYTPAPTLVLRAEYRRVGSASDLDPFGNRAELPPGDELNLRGRWTLRKLGASTVSVTMAVDNLSNALIVPQLGLPSPGRALRIGLRID